MKLTIDEKTVLVEALREFRLRLPLGTSRRLVVEALIFRLYSPTEKDA